MAKNYREIWENVTNATEETKAIRALAEILADKEGRAFASRLERQDAEVCIEILDHVSRDQCLFLSLPVRVCFAGHHREQAQKCREAGFLRYVEEACWAPWATARFRGDKKD